MCSLNVSDELKSGYRIGSFLLCGLGAVGIVIGFLGELFTPITLLLSLLVLLLIPILYELFIWVRITDVVESN